MENEAEVDLKGCCHDVNNENRESEAEEEEEDHNPAEGDNEEDVEGQGVGCQAFVPLIIKINGIQVQKETCKIQ
jgi:hypothetical protein